MAKKWILGQKTAFSARNSAFFYATPMKPPFFQLKRSRLNGIISPPYPEVTVDTFSFPAVSVWPPGGLFCGPDCPKWPFWGQPCKGVSTKMLSFWCLVMMVTKKLDNFQKKWILGQKNAFLARNSASFYTIPMKPPLFFGSDGSDSMGS